jgi:glutamate-1-semialdehyde 2,1-aminomutase
VNIVTALTPLDRQLLDEAIAGFVPDTVTDIHAHVVEPSGYDPKTLGAHLDGLTLSPATYRAAMDLLLPRSKLAQALLFPFPARKHDRGMINRWMYEQLEAEPRTFPDRGLAIAGPRDDPAPIETALAAGRCVGIKSYHTYAGVADSSQVGIEDFTPEWMWRLCDLHNAILMLHIMRDQAIAEPGNQETLRRLGQKYPRCQVVLAHIARSFNSRTARGLRAVVDLPNMWVDTSAIAETETFRTALDILGPGRIMFGSDYPISHLRGRCVTLGDQFHWIHPADEKPNAMTLVGIESLRALRAACEQARISKADIARIFHGNAQDLLGRFQK